MLASRGAARGVRRDLGALAEREHDLLIVGGGIYGAAACWDAAQRGLRVSLVEKGDFGGGTSWNSLKTIHGGLRHLQRLELSLLRESVRERRAFLRIAPRLVRPLAFLVPTYGHGKRGREALALGLAAFDRLAADRNDGLAAPERLPASRMLSAAETRERLPGVPALGLTGGAHWHDAQAADSERLLLAFLRAASDAGAALANAAEVKALLREAGRATGARVLDHETGEELSVRARLTLLAPGPGMDGILRRAGIDRPRVPLLRARNLVLRRPVAPDIAVGARAGQRYLFLVPWHGRALVGTDYEPAGAPSEHGWLQRFLADVRKAFPWAGITAEDVALVHTGLVPGRGGADGLWTHSLVVDHERGDRVPGLVSVLGAKYTTARAVAEKAVDLAVARLGAKAAPCRTAVTPLPHAAPPEGTLADVTLRGVREEMALHLPDVVLRRSGLGAAEAPAAEDVEAVLRAMGDELRWSPERRLSERESLRQALAAHEPRPE